MAVSDHRAAGLLDALRPMQCRGCGLLVVDEWRLMSIAERRAAVTLPAAPMAMPCDSTRTALPT